MALDPSHATPYTPPPTTSRLLVLTDQLLMASTTISALRADLVNERAKKCSCKHCHRE